MNRVGGYEHAQSVAKCKLFQDKDASNTPKLINSY